MSDEERAMQAGTHELVTREDDSDEEAEEDENYDEDDEEDEEDA